MTIITGDVVRYSVAQRTFTSLARKLQQPSGIARLSDNAVAVAESGSGKLLRIDATGQVTTIASDLNQPGAVVAASDDALYVSELGTGRVVKVEKTGQVSSVIEGLHQPQAIALRQNALLILDHGTKDLRSLDLATGRVEVLASDLPIGDPPGRSRGPIAFLGGLTVGQEGMIYIAGDGEGSVLKLQQR
jgi:sugar lactone lactonase YvrE